MKIRESCLQNGTFIYKVGISLTKQDFELQNEIFGLQTGLSVYYLPSASFIYLKHNRKATFSQIYLIFVNNKNRTVCVVFSVKPYLFSGCLPYSPFSFRIVSRRSTAATPIPADTASTRASTTATGVLMEWYSFSSPR